MNLEGSAALVTGASRGIGRAIALELASAGADVAVNYVRNQDAAEEVVSAVVAQGRRAFAIRADVSDFEQAKTCVEKAIEQLGAIDVLVNNAGISRDVLIYEMAPADWREVMETNFGSVFNCTRAVMEHMMSRRSGAIINISSVMGERAWTGNSAYSASKAAITSFTRSSALELARFGVRVYAVLPGFVETEMVGHLTDDGQGAAISGQIPARSFGRPEDVAAVTAFLAGSGTGYMTGALINVDGGATSVLGLGRPLPRQK